MTTTPTTRNTEKQLRIRKDFIAFTWWFGRDPYIPGLRGGGGLGDGNIRIENEPIFMSSGSYMYIPCVRVYILVSDTICI